MMMFRKDVVQYLNTTQEYTIDDTFIIIPQKVYNSIAFSSWIFI